MLIRQLFMLIPLLLLIALFWIFSDKIFLWDYKISKKHPTLYKIIGFNNKYLDDPALWKKHFRLYMVLFAVLFSCILLLQVIVAK